MFRGFCHVIVLTDSTRAFPAGSVAGGMVRQSCSVTTVRTVFLDFDGTLADRGVVPAAHVSAIRAARENGHRVLLCTGRPLSMLAPDVLAIGFDGVVAAAGGFVQIDGQVLVDRRFPAGLSARALQVLMHHDVGYLLEAPEAVYIAPGAHPRLHRWLTEYELTDGFNLAGLRVYDDAAAVSFSKVTCFDSPMSVTELASLIGPEVGALPSSLPVLGSSAGELFQIGVHKAVGIEVVMQHLGLTRDDVVAVGDGANDVEMLEFAGIGVAIDGGDPRLLASAKLVVPGPERSGLVDAFTQLSMI